MSEWQDKIDLAETQREKGEIEEALSLLTQVIDEARECSNYSVLASALSHRVLCYKHLYQNTRKDKYLDLLEEDVDEGTQLDIPEQKMAVFYLRSGDITKLRGYSFLALDFYEMAYECVKKGGVEECEYAGHYAEALADSGEWQEANNIIIDALHLLYSLTDVRPFHRLILLSGLFARQVKALRVGKKYFRAVIIFFLGYLLAWKLKLVYKMPQRLNQYHQAIKNIAT